MLNAQGVSAEVTQNNVLCTQLSLLNLPHNLIDMFLQHEIDVECDHLEPNTPWIESLKQHRANGGRVIAISDTHYSAQSLSEIISRVTSADIVDQIYTSADLQATKRRGGLFEKVIEEEGVSADRIFHVGDDLLADQIMASEAGIKNLLVPRSHIHTLRRRGNGALFEGSRLLRNRQSRSNATPPTKNAPNSVYDFGHQIMGPIVFEACIALWAYLDTVVEPADSTALFCARGGLRMRLAFERVLACCDLPLSIKRRDFMISRLVAAKAALSRDPDAALSEICRVYERKTMSEFVAGFGGGKQPDPVAPEFVAPDLACPDAPANEQAIREFLASSSSRPFRESLDGHHTVYNEYIKQCTDGSPNPILVDTGLYGTTLHHMNIAYPDYNWSSLLLARSGYPNSKNSHFKSTIGAWIESDGYSPFNQRSTVLRYWQLIEVMFEPNLPSAASFAKVGDRIISNVESDGWRERLHSENTALFEGVMDYLKTLKPGDQSTAQTVAQPAWQILGRAIRRPTPQDLSNLSVPDRSLDFGLEGHYQINLASPDTTLSQALNKIRYSSWKEGAAATAFPTFRLLTNMGLEALQTARFLRRNLHRTRNS